MSIQMAGMMAKKSVGRPKGERDDVAIKFDRVLKMKADLIAADQAKSTAEYLTEIARPAIEQAYAELVRKVGETRPESSRKKVSRMKDGTDA